MAWKRKARATFPSQGKDQMLKCRNNPKTRTKEMKKSNICRMRQSPEGGGRMQAHLRLLVAMVTPGCTRAQSPPEAYLCMLVLCSKCKWILHHTATETTLHMASHCLLFAIPDLASPLKWGSPYLG